MNKEKMLEYLMTLSQPAALEQIAGAVGLTRRETAQLLQQLSRENKAFRSLRGGHAYYSADPAKGEGALPSQAFIDRLNSVPGNGMPGLFGGLFGGQPAVSPAAVLSEASPVHWTFTQGRRFENEQFSVAIPNGFALAPDPGDGRAFTAVPEGFEQDSASAPVQIMDSSYSPQEPEPVCADPEPILEAGEKMAWDIVGRLDLNDPGQVTMKRFGSGSVIALRIGPAVSYMLVFPLCRGTKMFRVLTQETPEDRRGEETDALIRWADSFRWKNPLAPVAMDDPALTRDPAAWLAALEKKIVSLATFRRVLVENTVRRASRENGGFRDVRQMEETFARALSGTFDPVMERTLSAIAAGLRAVDGVTAEQRAEKVETLKKLYPVRVKVGDDMQIEHEASPAIREIYDRMARDLDSLREEQEAKARAELEALERKQALEREQEEARRREREAQKRRVFEEEQARREEKVRLMREARDRLAERYRETEKACREDASALEERLRARRTELAGMGLLKLGAKKQARADIESMEAEQRALPERQKRRLLEVWKNADQEQRRQAVDALVYDYVIQHNAANEGGAVDALKGLPYMNFDAGTVRQALERLRLADILIEEEEDGQTRWRSYRDGETIEQVRLAREQAARIKAAREEEERRKREEQERENETIKLDILTYLCSGIHASASEIKSAVPSLKDMSIMKISAILRMLKLEGRVDKEVVKGTTYFFAI